MRKLKNARIERTTLGVHQDYGIFTFTIVLDYGGSGQHFCGVTLDTVAVRGVGPRIPTKYGLDCIMRLLKAVGVSSWEDLPNKNVRAIIENGMIIGLMNFLDDENTFLPGELYKEQYEEKQ